MPKRAITVEVFSREKIVLHQEFKCPSCKVTTYRNIDRYITRIKCSNCERELIIKWGCTILLP